MSIQKFIRNTLLRNWGLKLFSLLLAFVVWLILIPEEKVYSERTLTIPLETHNIPQDMEIVEKPQSMIDVVLRAPNRLISQLSAANVFAQLNLADASIIQEEFPLNPTMISLPPGVEVIHITPNKVNLKLERSKEAFLEVEPKIIGQPMAGYEFQKAEVSPLKIPVRGPESRIREVERRGRKIETTPIDISSLSQSTEFHVQVILPGEDLRIPSNQTTVRVRVIISERR